MIWPYQYFNYFFPINIYNFLYKNSYIITPENAESGKNLLFIVDFDYWTILLKTCLLQLDLLFKYQKKYPCTYKIDFKSKWFSLIMRRNNTGNNILSNIIKAWVKYRLQPLAVYTICHSLNQTWTVKILGLIYQGIMNSQTNETYSDMAINYWWGSELGTWN